MRNEGARLNLPQFDGYSKKGIIVPGVTDDKKMRKGVKSIL